MYLAGARAALYRTVSWGKKEGNNLKKKRGAGFSFRMGGCERDADERDERSIGR
jgi:hypothetical protein